MCRRPWLINGFLLSAICAAIGLYVFVAEVLDLHLLGLRVPGTSVLNHRLEESMLLWGIACSGLGWVQYAGRKRPPRHAATWPILVFPIAAAAWLAGCEAYGAFAHYRELAAGPIPLTVPRWYYAIGLFGIALWCVHGAVWSVALYLQARVWRLPIIPGICAICGYDLTGNESGTCPECGTRIIEDQDIPRSFHAKSFRWTPELAFFPDARSRYDAWKEAYRSSQKSKVFWVALALAMLGLIVFTSPWARNLAAFYWPALGAMLVLALAVPCSLDRAARRSLRQVLRARGICGRCGRELVEDRCPEGHK